MKQNFNENCRMERKSTKTKKNEKKEKITTINGKVKMNVGPIFCIIFYKHFFYLY